MFLRLGLYVITKGTPFVPLTFLPLYPENLTLPISYSTRPRSHFRSVLSKILRLGAYPNPQTLTKY